MHGIVKDLLRLPPALQALALAALCWPLPVMSLLSDLRIADWPMTGRGVPVLVDFANFWLGAQVGLTGEYATLFDRHQHVAHAVRHFGDVQGLMVWSYMPPMLLLVLPFGLVSNYGVACALWLACGIGAFVAALRFGGGASWRTTAAILAALLLMPGTVLALSYGQTALLTSAALAFGLLLAPTRPILAGAVLALLICKPHLGLMVPAALLGLGSWRAFVATPVFAALYVAVSVAVFGPEPWQLFVSTTLPQQMAFLTDDAVAPALRLSPYFLLAGLGFDVGTAMHVQIALALAVMGVLIASLRREADPDIQFLSVALATLLASPYLQVYELPLLGLAIGRVALSPSASIRLGQAGTLLLAATATLGVLVTTAILSRGGCNLTPALLIALFCWLNRETLAAILATLRIARPVALQRT